MKRHDFDALSFIFGLLFVGAGLPLLFSESGYEALEARWIFPGILIIAGAVVLATTRRRMTNQEPVVAETPAEPDTDSMVR